MAYLNFVIYKKYLVVKEKYLVVSLIEEKSLIKLQVYSRQPYKNVLHYFAYQEILSNNYIFPAKIFLADEGHVR